MYPCCYYLPSYLTLLTLHYGECVERSQVAWERAKEEGISFRESEWMVDSELFLDEYHTKCSSTLQGEGRKRWNTCSAEATGAVYPNLILGWTNLPWN